MAEETLSREQLLERRFPGIPWREPLRIETTTGVRGLACRFCVAVVGLSGKEISQLPQTAEAFAAHLATTHGLTDAE